MPARSVKQQRLAGMADAYLKGELKSPSGEVKKFAAMGRPKVREFSGTKTSKLPMKVGRSKHTRGTRGY
jgi:hypothetical protein